MGGPVSRLDTVSSSAGSFTPITKSLLLLPRDLSTRPSYSISSGDAGIYAMASLDAASTVRLSFKCTPEEFAELTERLGIIPAPYVARYHWVALERWDALPAVELKRRIRESYELVRDKLPAKVKDASRTA